MTVTDATWTLTPRQLYVLWGDLGLADFPYPLDVTEPAEIEPEDIARELAAAGLLEGGQPKPALDEALRLLAQRRVWVDSIWLPDERSPSPHRVVGVWGDEDGVLVAQTPGEPYERGGALSMRMIGPPVIARETVGLLPPERPGGHAPVTVAAEELREATLGREHPVTRLLTDGHLRVGQLAANRHHDGCHHRSAVIRWFDRPDDGRYLVILAAGDDGEVVTVSPADQSVLAAALDHELRSLTTD